LPSASILRSPRKMLLVSILIWGISIASVMGNAILKICLLVTLTFKSGVIAVLSIKSAKISYFAAEMQHVNPSFNIQATGIDFETAQLFAEAGPTGISLAVLGADNCFNAVVTYAFATGLSDAELTENLKTICSSESLLQKPFAKTHIFWSFTESILVPAELMNADRNVNMLNLVFGDARQGIIRSDFLYKHNLHNVYRLPDAVAGIIASYLPVATQTHLFSALVNKDMPAGNHLFTVFYSNSLTIVLCKEGDLQVVQNFTYNNADDCVFHLLNVCKGFDVEPDSTTLHINGMIDSKSGLYAAIYKYFLNIVFDMLPDGYTYTPEINNYPPHFFSHLFELASCV
jgi:Protein of unknown function (DUF3822)